MESRPTWRQRWAWWVAGSVLIAAASAIVSAAVGSHTDADGKGGIRQFAFGLFFASNSVVVQDGGAK